MRKESEASIAHRLRWHIPTSTPLLQSLTIPFYYWHDFYLMFVIQKPRPCSTCVGFIFDCSVCHQKKKDAFLHKPIKITYSPVGYSLNCFSLCYSIRWSQKNRGIRMQSIMRRESSVSLEHFQGLPNRFWLCFLVPVSGHPKWSLIVPD